MYPAEASSSFPERPGLWDTDFNPLNNFILSDLMGVSFTQIHTEYAQNTWSSYIKKITGFLIQWNL